MKTTTNTIKFPSTAKFFAFVGLISGLAFLSCLVASAQVSQKTTTIAFLEEVNDSYADVLKSGTELPGINMDQVWAARLESALVPETETRLEVESWMLDAEYTADVYEANVELEAWMLDAEFTTEGYEEAVELEDWMLDTDYFFSPEVYEKVIELEDWMLDVDYFTTGDSNEEPIELEDWMLN